VRPLTKEINLGGSGSSRRVGGEEHKKKVIGNSCPSFAQQVLQVAGKGSRYSLTEVLQGDWRAGMRERSVNAPNRTKGGGPQKDWMRLGWVISKLIGRKFLRPLGEERSAEDMD